MKKILLVEDIVFQAQLTAAILRDYGYEVEIAHDGGSALYKMGTFRPDVVILDLMLPNINGWEMLDSKHQNVDISKIPVIVCSAYSEISLILPGNQVVSVLTKPIETEVLLTTVEKVLKGVSNSG